MFIEEGDDAHLIGQCLDGTVFVVVAAVGLDGEADDGAAFVVDHDRLADGHGQGDVEISRRTEEVQCPAQEFGKTVLIKFELRKIGIGQEVESGRILHRKEGDRGFENGVDIGDFESSGIDRLGASGARTVVEADPDLLFVPVGHGDGVEVQLPVVEFHGGSAGTEVVGSVAQGEVKQFPLVDVRQEDFSGVIEVDDRSVSVEEDKRGVVGVEKKGQIGGLRARHGFFSSEYCG